MTQNQDQSPSPPEQPPKTEASPAKKSSFEREVKTLERLTHALQRAQDALAAQARAVFFAVFVPDEGAASLHEYAHIEGLKEFVRQLRDESRPGCLYMFHGTRVMLDCRGEWALHHQGETFSLAMTSEGPALFETAVRLPGTSEPVLPEPQEDAAPSDGELLPEYEAGQFHDPLGGEEMLPPEEVPDDLSE